jgi:hypothetical protein
MRPAIMPPSPHITTNAPHGTTAASLPSSPSNPPDTAATSTTTGSAPALLHHLPSLTFSRHVMTQLRTTFLECGVNYKTIAMPSNVLIERLFSVFFVVVLERIMV